MILCIIKQCPGFSTGIKSSTVVWFPCPFTAVGPASGVFEQQLWITSSPLTTYLVVYVCLQEHYAGSDVQRSITWYPSLCLGYFPVIRGIFSNFYSTRGGAWRLILNFSVSEGNVVVLHPSHHLVSSLTQTTMQLYTQTQPSITNRSAFSFLNGIVYSFILIYDNQRTDRQMFSNFSRAGTSSRYENNSPENKTSEMETS